MAQLTEKRSLEEREKYILAWNNTMVAIWKEQIAKLGVIDTGALFHSVVSLRCDYDGKITNISLSQSFLEYGLWQDYGTGKEVPRGNPGDIGRKKKRKRREWFSPKYYASLMNLKEFMAESLGREFIGMVSDALNSETMRRRSMHRAQHI